MNKYLDRYENITSLSVHCDSVELYKKGDRISWIPSVTNLSFDKTVAFDSKKTEIQPLDLGSILTFKTPQTVIVKKRKNHRKVEVR